MNRYKLFLGIVGVLLLVVHACEHKQNSQQVLTHWLQGSYQAESNAGLITENWSHPRRDVWIGEREIMSNGQMIEQSKIEIKNVDDDLSVFFTHQQVEHIIPSKIVDMRTFDFGIDREEVERGPYRIKFEKISEDEFRRVHYVIENGRNSIETFDFKKIKSSNDK